MPPKNMITRDDASNRNSRSTLRLCFLGLASAVLVAMASGCASSIPLERSKYLPSATARAKLSGTSDGGTRVALEMTHLAEPARVIPGTVSYVVWVTPLIVNDEPEPSSLGAIALDSNLEANFVAETPLRRFRLFVTAEKMPTVSVPSGPELFWFTRR